MQLTVFSLGNGEKYAVNAMNVVEIISTPDLQEIPGGANYVGGILVHRDMTLTAIRMCSLLKISDVDCSENYCMIMEHDGIKLGLLIEQVHNLETIDRESIQTPPIDSKTVHGMVTIDGELISIICARELYEQIEL